MKNNPTWKRMRCVFFLQTSNLHPNLKKYKSEKERRWFRSFPFSGRRAVRLLVVFWDVVVFSGPGQSTKEAKLLWKVWFLLWRKKKITWHITYIGIMIIGNGNFEPCTCWWVPMTYFHLLSISSLQIDNPNTS